MPNELEKLKTDVDALLEEVFRNRSTSLSRSTIFNDFAGRLKIPARDSTPATCLAGEVCEVSGDMYVCTAQDTWSKLLSATKSYTAGETISANNPVRVVITASTNYTTIGTNSLGATVYGTGGDYEKIAMPFVVPSGGGGLTSVTIPLRKHGTPSDNLLVDLVTDNAGAPSATTIASQQSQAASGIPSDAGAFQEFTFNYTLTGTSALAAATYWVVLSRSGSRDTNNYVTAGSTGNPIGGYKLNSATWQSDAGFGGWNVTTNWNDGTAGQIKRAYANITPYTLGFVGFAPSAIANGATGSVQSGGYLSGFSSLTLGTQYLKDDGTIGSTAGTVSLKVGKAVSTTEILILILA